MDPAIEAVVLANSKFSIDMLKHLCKDNTDNVLFSPLSISSAMGLVTLGAKGETLEQMKKYLRFGEMVIMYHDLYEALYKGGKNRNLQLVNRMFGESTVHFCENFLDECEEWCYASVRNVDFKGNPDVAREKINTWVKSKTGDNIENLLDEEDVSKDTRLALISAVSFKGNWAKAFHGVPADKSKGESCKMMYQINELPLGYIPHRQHHPSPKARILEIPYENKDLSMLIILPEEKDGLPELVEMITYEKLLEWTEPDNMIPVKNLYVKIPPFDLKVKYDMEKHLEALGITKLFSDKCDLTKMGPGPLKMSKVVHKSFVKVDEAGTEADGGSGGGVHPKSQKCLERFVADHPFLFFIRHNLTKSIIFWGRHYPKI